jgi:hypothetical protein
LTNTNVVQNLTVKTQSGVRTQIDVMSRNPAGQTVLQEAKSSAMAPLTPNQAAAHPADRTNWSERCRQRQATIRRRNKYFSNAGTSSSTAVSWTGMPAMWRTMCRQTDVVDMISPDQMTGQVILTVSDHLDWSDSTAHQLLLQAKLNRYLAFIESGEIVEQYPDAKGRKVTIKVVFNFQPDEVSRSFLMRVRPVIESAGFGFLEEVFNGGRLN